MTPKKQADKADGKIKIDKGIPVPPHRYEGTSMYPFAEMEVGDSFHAPDKKVKNFYPSVTKWKKKLHPKNFIVRQDGKGVRVWRIPDVATPAETEE